MGRWSESTALLRNEGRAPLHAETNLVLLLRQHVSAVLEGREDPAATAIAAGEKN